MLCAQKLTSAGRSSLWVHALEDGDLIYPLNSPTLKSYQLNDLPLGILIGTDVSLCYMETRINRQHLHVSDRPTHKRNIPHCIRDEGAPPAMT